MLDNEACPSCSVSPLSILQDQKLQSSAMAKRMLGFSSLFFANKESERRKALTDFFVHLVKLNVVDVEEIISIQNKLCDLILRPIYNFFNRIGCKGLFTYYVS